MKWFEIRNSQVDNIRKKCATGQRERKEEEEEEKKEMDRAMAPFKKLFRGWSSSHDVGRKRSTWRRSTRATSDCRRCHYLASHLSRERENKIKAVAHKLQTDGFHSGLVTATDNHWMDQTKQKQVKTMKSERNEQPIFNGLLWQLSTARPVLGQF